MSKPHRPYTSTLGIAAGRTLMAGLVAWGVASTQDPGRLVASQEAFEARQEPLRTEERTRMAEEDLVVDLSGIYSMEQSLVRIVHTEAKRHLRDFPDRIEVEDASTLTHILLGIIREESGGRRLARGDGGRAMGLTQIWLTTAQQYGPVEPNQLLDPITNVRFALHHFSYLMQRHDGDVSMALYAWNYGERRLREITSSGRKPRNGYATRVLAALPS